jgi:hypothetical protein
MVFEVAMAVSTGFQVLPLFDELIELAKENPEAFEVLKKDICEEAILSSSEKMQNQLWAQQSHIDRLVGLCKTPAHINMKLMKELSLQMSQFRFMLDDDQAIVNAPPTSATILPFNKKTT